MSVVFAAAGEMKKRGTKRLRGFSLAEAMMAMVVLGLAASGLLMPFTSGTKVRDEGSLRTLASRLATDLTEQIAVTDFDMIVADWDGYSEADGQVKDCTGAVFTDDDYAKFRRQVSCDYVYVPQESGSWQARFILVNVAVYYSGRETAVVNRLISDR